MKKIAIITPFLARGGLEKVAVAQATELSKYYNVTLIVLDSFIQDYPYSGRIIDLGVSLENRGILKRMTNIYRTITKLWKIKKENHFELIISHGELANIPNVFSGGKCILVIHENRFGGLKDMQGRFVNKIINFTYTINNVQKIVTVSEGIRYSFLDNLSIGEKDIITIPNPHNIDNIIKMSKESLGEFETLFKYPVLINVGRLIKEKGQWYLLRIFAELKKLNLHVKLIILGDAGLREELISLSKSLHLKTYSVWSQNTFNDNYDVYFLGFHSNPFKFMAKSKLFVMTSLREGLPNTLIEALACGVSVISTNCQTGPSEILFPEIEQRIVLNQPKLGKYGILMPIFSNDKFIGANIPLSKEEKLWIDTLHKRLAQKINLGKPGDYEERSRYFEIDKVIIKWKKLIDQIISNEEVL